MPQTVLPFKLDTTSETLTPHAGLALVGEFAQALGLPALLDRQLPAPGNAAGYRPSQFVMPLALMLHGGGRTLEDLREIREDGGLREVLEMEQMPSSDATGDWLRRMGNGAGLEGLAPANRALVRRGLKHDGLDEYTLDIDATQIVAEKQEARWTYQGERGYMPMVGHLAENGLVVGDEFREGNESPGARNLEFIEYCAAQMPQGKRIAHLRSDSAAYQAKIFNYCEANAVTFAIGADLDAAVRAAIAAIPEEDWKPYQDGHIAETVHSMNGTDKAFRLVVIRRPIQRALFEEEATAHRYKPIASNRTESPEATAAWYNRRGETSENRIKELKLGFGMERMPCGQRGANAVFFRIGVLAYNLFVLFKRQALPSGWRKHQVQTLRWRLYQAAGKVAHHAGRVTLRVLARMFGLFEEVRARCREAALA
jgi:hypothetical protein